jgi:hypothetical protein
MAIPAAYLTLNLLQDVAGNPSSMAVSDQPFQVFFIHYNHIHSGCPIFFVHRHK